MKNTKKLLIFFAFISMVQFALQAQDKIITTRQDTIICRIVSVSGSCIIYDQKVDGKQVMGKKISFDEVGEYYRFPQMVNTNIAGQRRFGILEHPWLLSVSAGGACLPWQLESIAEEYSENDNYSKLNKGFAMAANAHYLFTNHVGFGVQYSCFTSSVKSSFPVMVSSFYSLYSMVDIRERQYINYVGLSGIFRQFLDKSHKFSLNETLGGGLLLYRGERQSQSFMLDELLGIPRSYYGQSRYYSRNTLLTGSTFGATFGISAEYKILPYLTVGIGGKFLYGSVYKIHSEYKRTRGVFEIINDEPEYPFNLSLVDYSLVVRVQL